VIEERPAKDDAPFQRWSQDHDGPVRWPVGVHTGYSGRLGAGESVFNVAKKSQRAHRSPGQDACPIGARTSGRFCRRYLCRGAQECHHGDTICDERHPILLDPSTSRNPVIQLAIEPKTKADQEKLGWQSRSWCRRSHLRVSTDVDTGQTILAGMGELHLEIIVTACSASSAWAPKRRQAAGGLREKFRSTAEYDYTHKKQTGGSGQYARLKLRVEANHGKGSSSRTRFAVQCPQEFIPAVEKGRPRGARRRPSWPAIRWWM